MKVPGFIVKSAAKGYIARMSDIDISDDDRDYMTPSERAMDLRQQSQSYEASKRHSVERSAHNEGMPSLVKHIAALDRNGQRDRFISECVDQIKAYQSSVIADGLLSKPFDEELVRLGLEACYDQDIARINERDSERRDRATDRDLVNDVRVGVRAVYPRGTNGSDTQLYPNEFDYSIRLLEDKGSLVKYEREHGVQLTDDYGAPYAFLHTFEDGSAVPYTVQGHESDNRGIHEERKPTLVYGTLSDGVAASKRVPLDTMGIRESHFPDGFAVHAIQDEIKSGACTPPIVSDVPSLSVSSRGHEFDDMFQSEQDDLVF